MAVSTSKIIHGIGWTTFANIGGQVISLGSTMVLARLVLPAEFGLVAMILVFTHFATMLADFGLASSVVHKQDTSKTQLSTLFWLNMLLGLGFLVLGLVGAETLSALYDEPALIQLTYGLSLCFVLSAIGMVPGALLRKEMRFKIFAILTMVGLLCSRVVAIICAVAGFGAWSLVLQSIVQAFMTSVLYLKYSTFRPQFVFQWHSIRPMLRYSLGFTGYNIINFWAKNVDNLLVGKVVSAQALGHYSQAYYLMRLPVTQVMGSLTGVMFPAMSAIQHDKPACKKLYLKTMSMLSIATFPIAMIMLMAAEPLVLTFLGDQWRATIPLLQILAVTGISSTFSNPTGWIYTSQGRTDWMFWWGVFGSGTLIAGIIIGALWGTVESIALGYTIAHVLLSYWAVSIPGKLLDMRFIDVLKVSYGSLLCAIAMAIIMWATHLLIAEWLPLIRFLILIVTGVGAYCALLYLFKVQAAKDIVVFIKQRRQAKNIAP